MRVLIFTCLLFVTSMAQTDYPNVLVVDVGFGSENIEDIRVVCTERGRRLVSLQDAGHLQYLKEQLQAQKGDSYFTSGLGTAVGYMYNYDHHVYDLNEPTRSLDQILKDAVNQGYISYNQGDSGFHEDQPWAGFGWTSSTEIHDWSYTDHGAVFCEEIESDYPSVTVVDVGIATASLDTIRNYCTQRGQQLVSVRDAGHIQYLKQQLLSQKDMSYFTSGQGIAMGYMYNNDHRVYDLNDASRDLSTIFQEAMSLGYITYNEADPTQIADQPWAGFGWGSTTEVHDWGGTGTTKAVFCEDVGYPSVTVIDTSVGGDIETIRQVCTNMGSRLVSVQDALHVAYLRQELLDQKGESYFTSGQGTALGYMYNNDHHVYDLNDPARSLDAIFSDAVTQGIITYNEADANHAADQPWAGFGWTSTTEIHDWGQTSHKAVFCEESKYPTVTVVEVGFGSENIEDIRAICTARGDQLVSLQDAFHLEYLKQELLRQKGETYFTHSQGTAVGYMYNYDHHVYDLNDPTRSLDAILKDAVSKGIITVNQGDSGYEQDQPWAGYGWGSTTELHDWSYTEHAAVFCEEIEDIGYPDVEVVDVGYAVDSLETLRSVCTQRGQSLVSVLDAGHIEFLKVEMLQQKGESYFTSAQGVSLGYMYNNDHEVFDLNDPSRSLDSIFKDALAQGYITYNEADASHSADQPWAGFGWTSPTEIHDWPDTNIQKAVFCEIGDAAANLMEDCVENPDNVPMSEVTGERSSISGDSVSIILDFPGYMTLGSIKFSGGDSTTLDSWDITYNDRCSTANVASKDYAYADLMNVATITRSNEYAEFSVLAQLSYYTKSDVTGAPERISEQKEIRLGIKAPTSHVVSVSANFQPGSSLLYDIVSHGIVDESGVQMVYVEFRTFLAGGHTFDSACTVTSPYFTSEECSGGDQTSFTHETEGEGTLQTWTVQVRNSENCIEGAHTERIDVDLTISTTGVVERIQFDIDMVDEIGPDCRVVIGDFDLTSTVMISDGTGDFVDPQTDTTLYYLNQVIYFQVTFSSLMMPTYVTLSSMVVTQNNDVKCDASNCLDVAQFVCAACDGSARSAGSTYEFTVVMSDSAFEGVAGVNTETNFELTFGLEYVEGRRQLAKAPEVHKVPISFSLRDYDCHGPNALVSSVKTVACDVVTMTKTMMCSAEGWKDVSQCAAPGQNFFTIFGVISMFAVIVTALYWAFNATKGAFQYQAVSAQIQV